VTTIDRYYLARVVTMTAALTGVALLALLLERMLRILELVVNTDNLAVEVAKMLGTMSDVLSLHGIRVTPYVGLIPPELALVPDPAELDAIFEVPLAFFLAVQIVLQQSSSSNQVAALQSSGAGLTRIIAPFLALAVALSLIAYGLFGMAQPHGRYLYRAVLNSVMTQTVEAAVNQGAFVSLGDRTVFAERSPGNGGALDQVFVVDRLEDGGEAVLTAPSGAMRRAEDGVSSQIELHDGVTSRFRANGALQDEIAFDSLDWTLSGMDDGVFRRRGADEREMTFAELRRGLRAENDPQRLLTLRGELDARLARILIILVVPFFAAPLAMASGRKPQTAGLAVGLVLLIAVLELIELGESFAKNGVMPPWMGIWAPLALFAAASLAMFHRVAYTTKEPPLFAASKLLGLIRIPGRKADA